MDAFAAAPQCVNSDLVFVLEDSVAPGNFMPDACSVTAPLAAWPSNDPFDAVESWLASLDSADCESACPAAQCARAAARVLQPSLTPARTRPPPAWPRRSGCQRGRGVRGAKARRATGAQPPHRAGAGMP
jgi:hypothetical protein